MRQALFLALLSAFLALPGPARAACPAQTAGPLNAAADGSIHLCAPETDSIGGALDPGELDSCTVTATWPGSPTPSPTVKLTAVVAGTSYVVRFAAAKGDGTASGVCANVRGDLGPVQGPISVRWPLGAPGAPTITVR